MIAARAGACQASGGGPRPVSRPEDQVAGSSWPRSGRWYGSKQSGNELSMQIPGVHIETLHNPVRYTYAQIEKACAIAQMLNRGKLVLVEPPRR